MLSAVHRRDLPALPRAGSGPEPGGVSGGPRASYSAARRAADALPTGSADAPDRRRGRRVAPPAGCPRTRRRKGNLVDGRGGLPPAGLCVGRREPGRGDGLARGTGRIRPLRRPSARAAGRGAFTRPARRRLRGHAFGLEPGGRPGDLRRGAARVPRQQRARPCGSPQRPVHVPRPPIPGGSGNLQVHR